MNKINIKYSESITTKQGFLCFSGSLIYTIKYNTLIPKVICNRENASDFHFQTRKNTQQLGLFVYCNYLAEEKLFTHHEGILKLAH